MRLLPGEDRKINSTHKLLLAIMLYYVDMIIIVSYSRQPPISYVLKEEEKCRFFNFVTLFI
jgi:hypothetical protein